MPLYNPASLPLRGCLVKKSADQTAANYTAPVKLTFDTEVYDTDGFHDNVTNNTRLTVPAQLNGRYARISGGIHISALTANSAIQLYTYKNNSAIWIPGSGIMSQIANGSNQVSFCSAPFVVATNDYFEVELVVNGDTSVTVTSGLTYFAIEIVG